MPKSHQEYYIKIKPSTSIFRPEVVTSNQNKDMTIDQYKNIAHQVANLVVPVGEFIAQAFGQVKQQHALEKETNSLVSEIDIGAERMLVTALKEVLPEAGFITEEKTTYGVHDTYNWIIDPLDGTTNFLFGVPHVSISIALKVHGVTQVGVIHHVLTRSTYHTVKGHGAYKDGEPIRVADRKSLDAALVATGFPYVPHDFLPHQLKIIEYLVAHSRGVRRLGSAAIDLCMVAEGIFDVYFESSLNEWDTSAGMLLVREAGGIASDFDGNEAYEAGQEVIAGSTHLHPIILDLIKSGF
jgi:myo-inositol-1(or 4)-monophosphatase